MTTTTALSPTPTATSISAFTHIINYYVVAVIVTIATRENRITVTITKWGGSSSVPFRIALTKALAFTTVAVGDGLKI
ncbi:MAG: hypothetical protein GY746_06650 [Gammaproteobacteria bacterium]|nr:hypothetical protein [Gammaproteobacteria bacterium]